MMPVGYETRQFMHDGSYGGMSDSVQGSALDPYGPDSVPDLSSFNVSVSGSAASLLSMEEQRMLERDSNSRNLIDDDDVMAIAASVAEHGHLDLSTAPIPGLAAALAAMPALAEHTELQLSDLKSLEADPASPDVNLGTHVDLGLTTNAVTNAISDNLTVTADDASLASASLSMPLSTSTAPTQPPSEVATPASNTRVRPITKPERDAQKQSDGKYHCTFADCTDIHRAFNRKCEWNKHMDKHERPYRCDQPGCEKLPGFTYSGGLLRHQREVHGKHGGPKKTVNCPHLSCKRHTGKGFSRQENLNEHLRRVHTSDTSGIASPPDEARSLSDESEKGGLGELGLGRKRSAPSDTYSDEVQELREEVKRLRQQNQELQSQFQHQQTAMMQQITELQGALRLNRANLTSPPTTII